MCGDGSGAMAPRGVGAKFESLRSAIHISQNPEFDLHQKCGVAGSRALPVRGGGKESQGQRTRVSASQRKSKAEGGGARSTRAKSRAADRSVRSRADGRGAGCSASPSQDGRRRSSPHEQNSFTACKSLKARVNGIGPKCLFLVFLGLPQGSLIVHSFFTTA